MLFYVVPRRQDEAKRLLPGHLHQKLIEVDHERKLRTFCEKRTVADAAADALGERWEDYVVRISLGDDKQGIPVKQGVLTRGRVACY